MPAPLAELLSSADELSLWLVPSPPPPGLVSPEAAPPAGFAAAEGVAGAAAAEADVDVAAADDEVGATVDEVPPVAVLVCVATQGKR